MLNDGPMPSPTKKITFFGFLVLPTAKLSSLELLSDCAIAGVTELKTVDTIIRLATANFVAFLTDNIRHPPEYMTMSSV
ncbi:Uncharacterised protein [Staphylococcus aureus]|nr:Uncharacterised protein [Staphylococcus aureus]